MYPKRLFRSALIIMSRSALVFRPLLQVLVLFSCLPPQISQAADSVLERVIVTASRADQSLSESESSIGLIENLSDIGATHINEAMLRIPGAWISRGNGQEHLTAIRSPVLTGAGGCGAFLMAQDNIPLRASGFCNVNELFDANTEQASKIEVLKGPGSVWYGSNAMHGMVNVLTPAPDGETAVSMEAGPHDYLRAKVHTSNQTIRVDFNATSDNGYKHDSGFDQQKLNLKKLWQWAGFDVTSSFSASMLNQETAGFIVGDKVYKDRHLSRQNPNPEAYRDSRSFRFYSRFEKTMDNGGTLNLTPYARATDMTFIQHFLPGQAIEDNGQRSVGIQTSWHMDDWSAGIDVEFTKGELEEFQPLATTGSAFLVATIPQGKHYDYDVDATTLALFVQRQFQLAARTQLKLGVRYERIDYDYENNMLDGDTKDNGVPCGFGGCRFSRPADRRDDFASFSPKIGLIHNFGTSQQLYARVAQGFRAPQATELYRLQGSQMVSNIDSEKLNSIELGFRGQYAGVNYDVSMYDMEKDNFIFRDANRLTVDNGETSHRGIELSLDYAFSDSLAIDVVANYGRHQYENNPALSTSPVSGNDIDTAPRYSGSARLHWQPLEKLQLELEWSRLGAYFTDPENQNRYGGHTLLNLRGSYQVNAELNLFARIINLTNEKYAERADFAFGNDRYFVGEPISAYIGVRARL